MCIQQQQNGLDCSVFAITFMLYLVNKKDLTNISLDEKKLRDDLKECFKKGRQKLQHFPATKRRLHTKQVQGTYLENGFRKKSVSLNYLKLMIGSVISSVNRFFCHKSEELPNSFFDFFTYVCRFIMNWGCECFFVLFRKLRTSLSLATFLVIILWNLKDFCYNFDGPREKQNWIYRKRNFKYLLLH